jgi:hypothetical protein
VVLYQVKYEMIRPLQFLYHYDDDIIIQLVVLYQDVHNGKDDTIAIMQLVVVLYQAKYKMIPTCHFIYHDDDDRKTAHDNCDFNNVVTLLMLMAWSG